MLITTSFFILVYLDIFIKLISEWKYFIDIDFFNCKGKQYFTLKARKYNLNQVKLIK